MTADFSKPSLTSTKSGFPTEIRDNDDAIAQMFDGDLTSSNKPTNAKRMDSNGEVYNWNGTSWSPIGKIGGTSTLNIYYSDSGAGDQDGTSEANAIAVADIKTNILNDFIDQGIEALDHVIGANINFISVGSVTGAIEFPGVQVANCNLTFNAINATTGLNLQGNGASVLEFINCNINFQPESETFEISGVTFANGVNFRSCRVEGNIDAITAGGNMQVEGTKISCGTVWDLNCADLDLFGASKLFVDNIVATGNIDIQEGSFLQADDVSCVDFDMSGRSTFLQPAFGGSTIEVTATGDVNIRHNSFIGTDDNTKGCDFQVTGTFDLYQASIAVIKSSSDDPTLNSGSSRIFLG